MAVREAIFQNSLASGFVHFFTKRTESLAKSRIGFATTSATSMVEGAARRGRARARRGVWNDVNVKICARAHSSSSIRARRERTRARARDDRVEGDSSGGVGSRAIRGVVRARERIGSDRFPLFFVGSSDASHDDAVRCVCGDGRARGGGWIQRVRDVWGDGGAAEHRPWARAVRRTMMVVASSRLWDGGDGVASIESLSLVTADGSPATKTKISRWWCSFETGAGRVGDSRRRCARSRTPSRRGSTSRR